MNGFNLKNQPLFPLPDWSADRLFPLGELFLLLGILLIYTLVTLIFWYFHGGWLLPSSGPALWHFSRSSAINF
jgi:hypothetical protein